MQAALNLAAVIYNQPMTEKDTHTRLPYRKYALLVIIVLLGTQGIPVLQSNGP